MAIGKIEPIRSTTPSTAVSSVASASKNLQNQILMKQQNLKKLSTDSSLSIDEKEKQRQELQKEIEELKRKLEQMRLKQEETKKAEEAKEQKDIEIKEASETQTEKQENHDSAVEASEEHKRETVELSANEVQKMLDTNFVLKEEMVQQGAAYDRENTVRVLSSEIKQDELYGTDTSAKEERLDVIQDKGHFFTDAKYKNKTLENPSLIHLDAQVVIPQ